MKRSLLTLLVLYGLSTLNPADRISYGQNKDNKVQWYPVSLPEQAINNAEVLLPASRDYFSCDGLPVRVLFNHWVRDPFILNAPDGYYYMVGTTEKSSFPQGIPVSENANGWWYNDGIPLWRSPDLVHWETMGYVWSLDKDATWAKEYKFSPHTATDDGSPVRAVWAPEIHYMKGTYWIVYSMNYDGLGILKSTTGRPEGPYEDIKKDGPFPGGIDVHLFEDTDGTVYYLTDGYNIARMKSDMSGLAEAPKELDFSPAPPWAEGVSMMKVGDRYVWYGAGNSIVMINGKEERTYDCYSATSESVYGIYSGRYRAIPYAGHNNIFQDKGGHFWSTQFHPQPFMAKALEPAILPVEISDNGIISVRRTTPRPIWKYTTTRPNGNWTSISYDDYAWKDGESGFGNPEIQDVGSVSDVGTEWQSDRIWLRKKIVIDECPSAPTLFLRYTGKIDIWINGVNVYSAYGELLDYETVPIMPESLSAGENIIAVSLKSESELQYVDIGIVER